MKTPSDDIVGEVSSDDYVTAKELRAKALRSKALRAKVMMINHGEIFKKKEKHSMNNLPRVVDLLYNDSPLTTNPSAWSSRRRMSCIRTPLVNDFLLRRRRLLSLNKTNNCPGTTLCRKCGGISSLKNTSLCSNCMTQVDNVRGMPMSLVIKHCQGCERYSFTGRVNFVRASLGSTEMLEFLLRRIELHLYRSQLTLIDASFIPTEPTSNTIKIALLLQEEKVDGVKRHIIDYIVAHQKCFQCSPLCSRSECTYTVQLRRCDSDKRSLCHFLFLIQRLECFVAVNRCLMVKNGWDVHLDTENEAMACYDLLCNQLPIKRDKFQSSANNGGYIPAVVCPISLDDLVYLRSNNGTTQVSSYGTLVICTNVTNSIYLLDLLTFTSVTVTNDVYWSETDAYEVYKSCRDLVEYIVLGLQTISITPGSEYVLANVEVARISDYGYNDITFKTITHLGYDLKAGDQVMGYDLCGTNNGAMLMEPVCQKTGPDVVLIKKRQCVMRPITRRKNASPEYDEFLRDLEKNPEAMFNLSLNGGNKAENQQSVAGSVKENADYDLEGLLADLALGDQSGNNDEQAR